MVGVMAVVGKVRAEVLLRRDGRIVSSTVVLLLAAFARVERNVDPETLEKKLRP